MFELAFQILQESEKVKKNAKNVLTVTERIV